MHHKVDTLENGLTIVTKPMRHMESMSLGVWIRAGGRYETATNNGISHLLEHLLFKGTKKRDMRKIKEEIEGRGGSFNGFTAEEFTCYLVKLLSKDTELGVDILSDMVIEPRLDEEEVRKEKGVIIEEINMYKDIPAQHVHELLNEMMWPGQPLGLPLAGSEKSVRSLARKDICSYKDEYYNTRNMIIVATGRIDEDDVKTLSAKYFAGGAGKTVPRFKKADSGQKKARININFKKTEQTHAVLGFHSLDRFHPDRYVSSLLNIILGANMSSRLFHIVRDEMALCYEISSSVRRYADAGSLVISTGVDDKKLVKSLEVILGILDSMRTVPVSKEELRRAKEYYKGQLLFALEDTTSFMLWLGEKVTSGEKDFGVRSILDAIEAVTAEEIMRVAGGIFRDERINLAVIGPVRDQKAVKEVLHIR
jgi:predicted Zn-dependent peptidase